MATCLMLNLPFHLEQALLGGFGVCKLTLEGAKIILAYPPLLRDGGGATGEHVPISVAFCTWPLQKGQWHVLNAACAEVLKGSLRMRQVRMPTAHDCRSESELNKD